MKKFIAFFLFVSVMFLSSAQLGASNDQSVVSRKEQENIMNTQMNDLALYFIANGYSMEVQGYPDYYAGGYISELRDALVICVTDDSDKVVETIKAGTKNPDVRIQKVEYSLNELLSEQLKILENYSDYLKKKKADC